MVDRDSIIQLFPKLAVDTQFAITSPQNENYNCIAWAFGLYDDRWMQPLPESLLLDGVIWWPKGVKKEPTISAYIEAFKSKGFEICDSFDLEDKILKIALYENQFDGKV